MFKVKKEKEVIVLHKFFYAGYLNICTIVCSHILRTIPLLYMLKEQSKHRLYALYRRHKLHANSAVILFLYTKTQNDDQAARDYFFVSFFLYNCNKTKISIQTAEEEGKKKIAQNSNIKKKETMNRLMCGFNSVASMVLEYFFFMF